MQINNWHYLQSLSFFYKALELFMNARASTEDLTKWQPSWMTGIGTQDGRH